MSCCASHLLTHSVSLLLTQSLTCSLTTSLTRSLAHSLPIHPPTHSSTHPLTVSLAHSFVHSLTYSFSPSFIHSLTHLLAHSLSYPSFTHFHNSVLESRSAQALLYILLQWSRFLVWLKHMAFQAAFTTDSAALLCHIVHVYWHACTTPCM